MAGDPFWDKVVFRSTLDTFPPVDVSLQALPLVASTSGPALTTGVFGNALSYGAGNGAYRATTSGDAGEFGGGDFTVEGWFKHLPINVPGGTALFGTWPAGSRSWAIVVQEATIGTTSQIRLFASSDGTNFDIINAQSGVFTSIVRGRWYHFCLERSGNIARFYIDGVMVWKQTISGSLFNASDKPLRLFDDGGANHFNGARVAFDDLRITKGVARYGRDTGFALPTEAYPVEGAPIGPPSMFVTQGPGFGSAGGGLNRTRPWGFIPASNLSFSTVPTAVEGIIPANGVLSRLRLSISGNTQTAATTTVTVRVNDQPTALSIAIPPATNGEFEVVATVPVNAGDAVYLGYQNSSTGASPLPLIRMTQVDYASFDGKVRIIHGINSRGSSAVNVSEPGLRFSPISTYYDTVVAWKSSLDDQAISPMGAPGNIVSAIGNVRSNSLDAAAIFTLYKNGNPTSLTLTVPAGVTGKFTATGGPVSVIPGDNLSWGRAIPGLTSGSFWLTTLDTVFEAADGSYDLFTGPNLATTSPNWTAAAPGVAGFSGFGGLLDISTDDLASLRLPVDGSVSRLRGRGYTVGAPEEMPGFLTAEGAQQPLSVSFPTGTDMATAPWVLSADAPVSLLAGRKINFASVAPAGGVLENRRAAFALGVTIGTGGAPPSPEVTVPAGELTFEGLVPTLIQGQELTAVPGAVVISGAIPTLTEFAGITPGAGALVLSGQVPTLEASGLVDPEAGELRLSGAAPDVFIGVITSPAPGEMEIEGFAPILTEQHGSFSSQASMIVRGRSLGLATRASQAAVIALAEPPPPPVAASQAAIITLGEIVPSVQASQAAIIVLGHADPCVTRRADLWLITRTDGKVFAFTSHDRDVHFRGVTYRACKSLDPTATQQAAEIGGMGNMELVGLISDETITEADLYGGLFDDAYVEVWRASWEDEASIVDIPVRLAAGWCGSLSHGDTSFKMEVLGPGTKLAQHALVQTVTPGCRWVFGDPKTCGVNADSLAVAGQVVRTFNRARFIIDASDPGTAPQWANGLIRWTDGVNAGIACEVKSVDWDTGEVTLWAPPPYLPDAGDAFTLRPGCDKTPETCKAYANYLNFGGFPDLPGTDAIAETPDAKY